MRHQLIMSGRTAPIAKISTDARQGFFSPLTLTSYLMVNQISTSVFSNKYFDRVLVSRPIFPLDLFSSYQTSVDRIHMVFTPVRVYYQLMRWIHGQQYNPFVEQKQKHGLHPIARFYKKYQAEMRAIHKSLYVASLVLGTVVTFLVRAMSKRVPKWILQ